VRLSSSALASACAPATPIWLPVTAFIQHGVTTAATAQQAQTPTTAVGHTPERSSVVSVRLDSSALASATAPASLIWLTVTAFTQNRVAFITTPQTHITTQSQPQLQRVTHRRDLTW
jgi:hypothetical protein